MEPSQPTSPTAPSQPPPAPSITPPNKQPTKKYLIPLLILAQILALAGAYYLGTQQTGRTVSPTQYSAETDDLDDFQEEDDDLDDLDEVDDEEDDDDYEVDGMSLPLPIQ